MTEHHPHTGPPMTVARTLDVRRADKDINGLAAWIADLIRGEPGRLIDLSTYGDGGNRILVRTDTRHEDAH